MAARLKFVKGKWSKKRGRKESSAETNAQFIETAQGTAEKLSSSERAQNFDGNFFEKFTSLERAEKLTESQKIQVRRSLVQTESPSAMMT